MKCSICGKPVKLSEAYECFLVGGPVCPNCCSEEMRTGGECDETNLKCGKNIQWEHLSTENKLKFLYRIVEKQSMILEYQSLTIAELDNRLDQLASAIFASPFAKEAQ